MPAIDEIRRSWSHPSPRSTARPSGLADVHTGELDGTNSVAAHADQFWALHPGGALFLFADGSVRFIKARRPLPIFQALAMWAAGEVLSEGSY